MDKTTDELFNSASPERQENINAILSSLRVSKYYSNRLRDIAEKKLSSYSDSTVTAIRNSLEISGAVPQQSSGYISKRATLSTTLLGDPEVSERTVLEVMHFWPHFASDLSPVNSYEAIMLINGLKKLEMFKGRNLDEITGDELVLATAFLNTATILFGYCEQSFMHTDDATKSRSEASYYINDPDLINFVVKHYRRVEELTRFVEDNQYQEASDLLFGLPYVEAFKGRGWGSFTEADIDGALAYLTVTTAINMYAENSETMICSDSEMLVLYIEDHALQELVISNPQKASDLAAFIEERKSVDFEALSEYLNNDTALRNGVL